jgi:hypothetical protein
LVFHDYFLLPLDGVGLKVFPPDADFVPPHLMVVKGANDLRDVDLLFIRLEGAGQVRFQRITITFFKKPLKK